MNFGANQNLPGSTGLSSFTFGSQNPNQPTFGTGTLNPTQPAFGTPTQNQPQTAFGNPTQNQPQTAFGTPIQNQPQTAFGTPIQNQPQANFGTPTQNQPQTAFGTATQNQPQAAFGTTLQNQPQTAFGTSTPSQPQAAFGTTIQNQPQTAFGTATQNQPQTAFGTATQNQPQPAFGTATQNQPQAAFGTATQNQPQPTFGTGIQSQSQSTFGTSVQNQPTFGTLGGGDAGVMKFNPLEVKSQTTTATASTSIGTTAESKLTASANLSTATKTTDSASFVTSNALNFSQIEEHINKWTLELEEQQKNFTNQATTINAWDKLLIANNEKIMNLNDAVKKVQTDQKTLEQELEFISTQHSELEESLTPLQKELHTVSQVDVERSQMYLLVENLDTQLRQMSEDLKEVVDNLNEATKSQDLDDPISQIGKILNAHMNSLQWIESSSSAISTKLDEISKIYETLKMNSEKSNILSSTQ